jgi:hypothetical protein
LWFLIVLISLIVLLVFLSSIPLGMSFKLDTDDRPVFRLQVRWFFDLLRKPIVPRKEKIDLSAKKAKTRSKKKKKRRKLTVRAVSGLLNRSLLARVRRFLGEILRCLHVKNFQADFSLGTGDPADTGILFGILSPLVLSLPHFRNFSVFLEPDFSPDPVMRGKSSGQVRLVPARLVWALLKFILSWSVLRTVYQFLRLRWKKIS